VKTDDGTKYFIVSSIPAELFLTSPETLAFAAKSDGTPLSMDEVAGGPRQTRESVIAELAVMFDTGGLSYWHRIPKDAPKPLQVTIGLKLDAKGRKFR